MNIIILNKLIFTLRSINYLLRLSHTFLKKIYFLPAVTPNSSVSIHDVSWFSSQLCLSTIFHSSAINWMKLCLLPFLKIHSDRTAPFLVTFKMICFSLTELGSVCLSVRKTRNELAAFQNSQHKESYWSKLGQC